FTRALILNGGDVALGIGGKEVRPYGAGTVLVFFQMFAAVAVHIDEMRPQGFDRTNLDALHVEVVKQIGGADLGRIEDRWIRFLTVLQDPLLAGSGDAPEADDSTLFPKILMSNEVAAFHFFQGFLNGLA